MIEKYSTYFYGDGNSSIMSLIDDGPLEKTAEYSIALKDYIKNLKGKSGKTYALINALSAGEYYGANRNGDYFPVEALKKFHKTFESLGYVYKHHCFIAGTKVVDGNYKLRNIEDIEINDLVHTSKGNQKVLNIFQNDIEEIGQELNIRGIPNTIKCTSSHPFLIYKRSKIHCNHNYNRLNKVSGCNCKAFNNEIGEPCWIEAKDIQPGDYVVNKIIEHGNVDNSILASFIGWVASEGYINKKKNCIQFSFSSDNIADIESVKQNILDLGYKYSITVRDKYNITMISCGSIELTNIISQYITGTYDNKTLTSKVFEFSHESILYLLGKYIDGDGHIYKTGRNAGIIRIRSCSKQMLYILSQLCLSIGIYCTINYDCIEHIMCSPTNKQNYSARGSGILSINKSFSNIASKYSRKHIDIITNNQTTLIINGYSLYPVLENNNIDIQETVFNLEVENVNEYIVEHCIVHNCNKDPNKSLGKVIFSHYNDKMHRVELIIELDNIKAKDEIGGLKKGDLPATSMGSRVPFDVCSICGNKAKSRSEYCKHLKSEMGKILPGGKKVYAINTEPKFFDISIVLIPADKTSSFLKVFDKLSIEDSKKSLEKVAYYNNNEYIKTAEINTTAAIKKEVPLIIENISPNPENLLEPIPNEVIEKLSNYKLEETLSTLLGLRIIPTKKDFQKLALYSLGYKKDANELEKSGYVFSVNEDDIPVDLTNTSLENFNEKIAKVLLPFIPNLTFTKEAFITRNLYKSAQYAPTQGPLFQDPQPPAERSLLSRAVFGYTPDPPLNPIKNPIIPLGILGGLYYGYAKLFNNPSTDSFRNFMSKYPWLIPLLIGGASVTSVMAQKNNFEKTAAADAVTRFFRNSLFTFPLSYYFASKADNKVKQGIPISSLENITREHPALLAIIGSLVGSKVENLVKKSMTKVGNFIYQLPIDKMNNIYNTLMEV